MNRRNFFGKLLIAGASFAILPPASTYSRIWKAERKPFWTALTAEINPAWHCAQYEISYEFLNGQILSIVNHPKDFITL